MGFVHWGANYSEVLHSQRAQARQFAEAGYDLVIGHGPHVVQPIDFVDGMPVVYSLGNFVFGTPGRFTEEFPGFGLAVTTALGPRGFEELLVQCLRTDNDAVRFQPQPCDADDAERVLPPLNDAMRVDGAAGTLVLGASP